MNLSPFFDGLAPAFQDARTGETHLARDAAGGLSKAHELYHLPSHWIAEHASNGTPVALHDSIVAGFHRPDRFLPLGAEIELPLDA